MEERDCKHQDRFHRHEGRPNRWLFDQKGRKTYVEDIQSEVYDKDSENE